MIGVIGSLFLRTRYADRRLDGLQGIHHPTPGALDDQLPVIGFGQFFVALSAANLFHIYAYCV
jgi:hypothetical protein